MKKLIDKLTKLKEISSARASVLSFSGETEEDALIRRTQAQATADAYAYCIQCLREEI